LHQFFTPTFFTISLAGTFTLEHCMRALIRYLSVPTLIVLGACSTSSGTARPAATATPAPAATSAAPATAVTAASPLFQYAPSAGQYRYTSAAKITQSMMGQSQDVESSGSRVVTITVARAAQDTLSLTVVLDSLNIVGPMGMTPPGIDKVPGSKFSAKVSPGGTVYSASGPSEAEQPMAATMTDEMARSLPRIKAALRTGATWTDTVSDKPKQNGIQMERRVISVYTVLADSTVGSELAWKIGRTSETTATGSGAPQGQNLTLETTSTSKGFVLIAKRGVLLGGLSEEQSNGKVTVTANAMEIGIKSTTTTTVQKIK
jgi:hypothetical protein